MSSHALNVTVCAGHVARGACGRRFSTSWAYLFRAADREPVDGKPSSMLPVANDRHCQSVWLHHKSTGYCSAFNIFNISPRIFMLSIGAPLNDRQQKALPHCILGGWMIITHIHNLNATFRLYWFLQWIRYDSCNVQTSNTLVAQFSQH